MRNRAIALLSIAVGAFGSALPGFAACVPGQGIGLSRIAEIDTATGPLYGHHTGYQKSPAFLEPKEVVLTFDDGPMPAITKSILDTLDRNCTKATFFSVGRMAIAYPATTRDILARGHTLGTHTWSHPLNLRRVAPDAAIDEIERGFAAVAMAAGQPIAPFFRFPGLNDNAAMLTHLQGRKVASFTVDVISNDSYIHDASRLVQYTLAQVEARKGGILLFHDIKAATARALPIILAELKARGYKVVHMRAAANFEPVTQFDAQLASHLAKAQPGGKSVLVPFYAAAMRPDQTTADQVPVTTVAPQQSVFRAQTTDASAAKATSKRPRARVAATSRRPTYVSQGGVTYTGRDRRSASVASTGPTWGGYNSAASSGGWSTSVTQPRLRRGSYD
jgi:peptidoglycan-N-acetylglucosamine deacetylase